MDRRTDSGGSNPSAAVSSGLNAPLFIVLGTLALTALLYWPTSLEIADLWIQRAELAMQFKRMEMAIEKRRSRFGDEQIERVRARVAEEYAAFRKSLEEWAKVRDQWVADRKQHMLQKWEETSFRLRLKQIELGLQLQRRRLRAMSRAYA